MPSSKLAKHGWKILFLLIAAFYLYGLGVLPLVGPDEPRYAQVAREMLERGDFITPTLGGMPWFEKPPLLYWLMMAGYRMFGVSEFAARLGPAICGLLTAGFVFWLSREITIRSARSDSVEPHVSKQRNDLARWSTFVFLSSLGVVVFSRGASFDIVLTMTVTGALSCWFVWTLRTTAGDGQSVSLALSGFYFFLGLSLLAKGLVGVVLPFGVVAAFFLLRREWPSKRFLLTLLWGIPLAGLVAGVWYGPMIFRHGWTFIDQFIVQHHFARFVSNKYHHPQPFYFYPPVLALLVLPWTILLVAAFIQSRRWEWRGRDGLDRLRVFAFLWVAVPLIFFSFSGSKIPGYVLPVLPAAALLVGQRITCFLDSQSGERVIRLTGTVFLLGVAVGAWYLTRSLPVAVAWQIAAAVPLLTAGSLALFVPRRRGLSFLMFGVSTLLLAAVALQPARSFANRESVRELIQTADARGYSSTPVFYLLCDERTAEFYAGGRLAYQPNGQPIRFEGAQELPPAIRAKGDAALVLIETRWERQLTDYKAVGTEKIGSNGLVTLFVVRPR